ncbi:MAG: dethiobiotin synthase, partial [Chitinophagaceae bacterium]
MNIFITGTGSGVGKTLVSAIITEALEADYWKPIQVGLDNGKDRDIVQNLVSNNFTKFHAERYILKFETSPHLAAAAEGINMTVSSIYEHARHMHTTNPNMIIEGVGGLKEPLNDNEFTLDLIKKLNASVIIV